MAEALGTVHMRRRGLLQRRWWPVGQKLVFNQMAAAVLEIQRSYCNILKICVCVF
jgi:hypothetical protein